MIEELEKLAKETEFAAGYERVRTSASLRARTCISPAVILPVSTRSPCFRRWMICERKHEREVIRDGERAEDRYYLKAMNCPHHHKFFAARTAQLSRSAVAARGIRNLLSLRADRRAVRTDARALDADERRASSICTPEQFESEFNAVNEMYLKYFKIFGIEKYLMRF